MIKISRIGKQQYILPNGEKVWLSPWISLIDMYYTLPRYKDMVDSQVVWVLDEIDALVDKYESPGGGIVATMSLPMHDNQTYYWTTTIEPAKQKEFNQAVCDVVNSLRLPQRTDKR